MMRCSHCGVDRETVLDPDLLFVSCPWCGKVLDQVYHASRRKKFGKRRSYEVFYGRDENVESLTDVDDFEKQKKQAAGNRNSATTKSPPERTCQVLKRMCFSSKINYKVLESLEEDNSKKEPTESGVGDNFELVTIDENYKKSESSVEAIIDGGGDLCTIEGENVDHYDDGNDDYCNNEVYGNGDDDYYSGDDEYGSDECEE